MNIYYDYTGLLHFVSACISLVAGTLVLGIEKGTRAHKIVGYFYTASMLIVFSTSFMIYRLYNGFGIFHVFAIIGTLTLLSGMVPILLFKKNENSISLHMSFMYWSVMGLYGAFVSETVVRLRIASFYDMLGVSLVFVFGLAAYFFIKLKDKWLNIYT